ATAAPVPTATALATVAPAVQPAIPARNDATEDNDTTGDDVLLRSPSLLYLYASTYPDSRQPGLLWHYDPNAALPLTQVMTDTTVTESITAAALAPGTGALALATTDGGLYLIEAGATPQHIWQSNEAAAFSGAPPGSPPFVNHLAWSADGAQLAFAVRYERTSGAADDRFGELAGLWLWQRASGESTQLWVSLDWTPYSLYLTDVAWSPTADTLAFTVTYDQNLHRQLADRGVEQVTGLWQWSAAENALAHLLDNHYFWGENVNELEVLQQLAWSPDGAALRVQAGYWEWTNPLWLFPVAPGEENVHRVPPRFRGPETFTSWINAVWRPNSTALLLFGEAYSLYSDLQLIDRESGEMRQIVDGQSETENDTGWYILSAHETAQGIFLLGQPMGGDVPSRNSETPTVGLAMDIRLYRIDIDATGNVQAPQLLSDEPICTTTRSAVAWQPAGEGVAVYCDRALQIIDMAGTLVHRETALPIPFAETDSYVVELLWAAD
ncbi:MAG TPA: hypothetical protein P5121_17575, partial [Caldilineaceae bacterium]|nr:hypothetical protein [Caldilineaceae bacterium]